ncbi:hypothetical protein BJ138DRAFT_1112380 [Hygrophoropsis aurantiaca]|uniref:Uncharacterized protein n=1 Tax=Hygrophoropsis aurantiaca TaxID=72124 RepID=A0ACB8AGP9_9AGAM|nr:hypothetical protein BJ138DRAFT_1112380 [Hygrophoropsis aurantiaca]
MVPIAGICSRLSLSNICNLVINDHSDLSEEFWLQGFWSATKLKSITLLRSSIEGFVTALAKGAPDGHQPGDNTIFLPALDSISLEAVAFDETQDDNGPRGVTPMDLRDALIARANYGVGIERLVIEECHNLISDDARLLEEVVLDLIWDHIQHCDGEGDEDSNDCPSPDYNMHRLPVCMAGGSIGYMYVRC